MRKNSFKLKIVIPTVVVLIVLVVGLNIFLSLRFVLLNDSLINQTLTANASSLNLHIDDSKAITKAAAGTIAINPDVINAIKKRDTKELLRIITPTHDLCRIDFVTVTDGEGIVLARTHQPDGFGDSVINQQNIKDALEGKVSSYFENGTTVKLSVRTGSPVYDTDGKIIGAISAGIRFDTDKKVNELKDLFQSEVTVFLGTTRIATTITDKNGQTIEGTELDPRIADIVVGQKQEYAGDANIIGEKYKTFYKPIFNSQGEVFSILFLGIHKTEIIATSVGILRDGIILGLLGLLISIVVLFVIMTSISKPIIKLSNDTHSIANGDLRINIDIKSKDELGDLGRSLQKVADILHKLIADINIMISEHEKGNIDYHLNTEEFLGDYRQLADNILSLSSFGMQDQLTGIPNRRTFDNRLDLEWHRAMRDKSPISVMILDVDKFKNYNDSFGHQQGDVALRTLAQTIKQTVKRSVDLAARWGGEEFCILLPSTDEKGAMLVAEKIRTAIESMAIPCDDERGRKVTASIGVSTQIPTPEITIGSFIAVADGALYKAKERGRNMSVLGENLYKPAVEA